MFTEKNIHISAAPDFVIMIGKAIHNHTIYFSCVRHDKNVKNSLFSHRSQIEVVKFVRSRLVDEGVAASWNLAWNQSDNLVGEVASANVKTKFEYRLPSQLPDKNRRAIYLEFTRSINLFVKSLNIEKSL